MNLDEILDAWRSQDEAPLYGVNGDALQQSLRADYASTQRAMRIEALIMYAMSTAVFAGLALVLVLMAYDDDARSIWDFLTVVLGAAAAVLWAGHLYLTRKRKALSERRFGASLRDEIGRHLTLMDYESSRVWRLSGVVMYTLPMLLCVTSLYVAIGQINNQPFDWTLGGFGLYFMAASLVYGVWIARHTVEHERLPRRRRLEALMEQLNAR
jgi:hypothetical protein